EFGPALRIDAYRGAQVDERLLEALRPHVLPPVDVAGMPLLQRALDAHVLAETDIVRDQPVVIDLADAGGDVHGRCPRVFRAQRSALAVRCRPEIVTVSC